QIATFVIAVVQASRTTIDCGDRGQRNRCPGQSWQRLQPRGGHEENRSSGTRRENRDVDSAFAPRGANGLGAKRVAPRKQHGNRRYGGQEEGRDVARAAQRQQQQERGG